MLTKWVLLWTVASAAYGGTAYQTQTMETLSKADCIRVGNALHALPGTVRTRCVEIARGR